MEGGTIGSSAMWGGGGTIGNSAMWGGGGGGGYYR